MAQYWKERIVEAGDVIENIIYLHPTNRSPSEKVKKTPDQKYYENLKRRIRDVARLLNCNFTYNDYFVTLTYSRAGYAKLRTNKPPNVSASAYVYSEADKEMHRFIARCRYHCSKKGIPFSCIFVTSNMTPKTFHYARIHHHLVVNQEALETIKDLWINGHVLSTHLKDQADYTKLAEYMLQQVPYRKSRNTYGKTFNLKKPIVTDRVLRDANKLLTPPEGAVVIKNGRNFLRYTFRKK